MSSVFEVRLRELGVDHHQAPVRSVQIIANTANEAFSIAFRQYKNQIPIKVTRIA